MCKKLIFAENVLFVNCNNFQLYLFFQEKKSDCPENLHTYSEKYRELKIKFWGNVKKLKIYQLKVADPPNSGD